MKTKHFWKAYILSNQKTMLVYAPSLICPPYCILQNGHHERGFVNISARFLWKVWKLYIFWKLIMFHACSVCPHHYDTHCRTSKDLCRI